MKGLVSYTGALRQGRTGLALLVATALCACVTATPIPVSSTTTSWPTAVPPTRTIAPPTVTVILPTVTSEPPTPEPTATSAPATPEPAATWLFISGPDVAFQGVRFTVSTALASGVGAQEASTADWGKPYPASSAYAEFRLVDYHNQNKFFEPLILICPLNELGEYSAESVTELRQLLAERPPVPEGQIPVLPFLHSGKLLDAQVRYLEFGNGSGVRVLTQFAQNTWPINNEGLVYVFQGMTSDGAYYVSAFLPAIVPFLPGRVDDPEAVPPVDGIPFPNWGSPDFGTQWSSYREAVTQKLNATPAQEFTPDLGLLDGLIQSFLVGPP